MKFTKMHGIGNDYIYVNNFEEKLNIDNMKNEIIKISHRNFGIGGDGVIFICPSPKADAQMRMFNADGSEGKMCGNGIRCVGKYVYDHGISKNNPLTIETLSGIKTLYLEVENDKVKSVKVDMGTPILENNKIPVLFDVEPVVNRKLILDEREYFITCLSVGNPHCVIFTDDVDKIELHKIGPKLEKHEIFPENVNVEFIQIINDRELKMRVWERGSEETFSCGTGASASVCASVLNGFCTQDTDVTVHLKGGDLIINYSLNNHIFMTGPATEVFSGTIDLNDLEA